jgi:hypothetical protein
MSCPCGISCGTKYTFSQLEQLWTDNGGPSVFAPMAAAIALAESGGGADTVSCTNDVGLWQINPTYHPGQATFDPNGNARAAVSISNNGTNWRPWSTAYSDGLGGTKGGSYLGAGSPFQKFLSGTDTIPQGNSVAGSGNTSAQQTAAFGNSSCDPDCAWSFHVRVPLYDQCVCLWQRSWTRVLIGGACAIGAFILTMAGMSILASQTRAGHAVIQVGERLGFQAIMDSILA